MAPRNTRQGVDVEVRSPARSFQQTLDNFYSPSRDTRREQAFQQGVSELSGIFGEKAGRIKQEERRNEHLQGVQDAMREEAGQELQGVKTGKLFRQHSSFYMMGLDETRGKAAARRFKNDLALAYEQWDGRHIDDDGSAFRDWMNQQVAGFMTGLGDNQYKIAGALPTINEVATNFAAHHTGYTAQRLEQEAWDAYSEIVSGVFDDLNEGKYDGEEGRDWDKLVDDLAAEADDMYATDGAAANDHLVQAAIRYANIHNDPDAILALARAHDSGKVKISLKNREKLANAMDAVEADVQRQTIKANAQLSAEEKARKAAALNNWAAELNENPYAELPDFAEVGDHATYKAMVALQDSFLKGSSVTNPKITSTQRMTFESDLQAAQSPNEKLRVLHEFTQSNPEALSGADIARYSQSILASSDPNSVLNHQTIGKYRSGFGKTLAEFQLGDGFDVNRSSYLRTQGETHFNDFLLAKGARVDMSDPSEVRELVNLAKEYAMEQLAFDFPEVLREKADQSPLGNSLGVDDALEKRDRIARMEALSKYRSMAEGDEDGAAKADADQADAVVSDQVDVAEAEPAAAVVEEEAEPVSAEEESFYGQMLKSFTDGVDKRPTYKDARAILKGDDEFNSAVQKLGDKYDIDPMALMAVMHFETGGSFSPSERNRAGSSATGLIQFMRDTAIGLGTTTEALAKMTRSQQMVYVEKYLDQYASRIRGGEVDDLYMAVLWPRAIGKPDGYALFRKGGEAYRVNSGLDTNRDGTITKFEAAAKVRKIFYSRRK